MKINGSYIDSCARPIDLGNSVFTLLMSLTQSSILLFNPRETSACQGTLSSHNSQYITLPMTRLGELKPNESHTEAT